MRTKALYLKINRTEEYALKNLGRWMDASYLMDADCYIVCDSDRLKDTILNHMPIYRDITFMQSDKSEELQFIVKNIADSYWGNAAYAHLTTFWHAHGKYDYFWNIDADDTRLCVSIDRMVAILLAAEQYAHEHGFDCFSLDMWRSGTLGKHWSFGIAYINGRVDWIDLCRQRCRDGEYFRLAEEEFWNLDCFFTYLKQSTDKKIETFYVENLKFIHYSNDFFKRPVGSGMYHWKDGKLIYPIMYYCFGIGGVGEYDIADDVVRLELDISDQETSGMLAYYAGDDDLHPFYRIEEIVNKKISEAKLGAFKKRHGYEETDHPRIVGFGAGQALEKNMAKIKSICDLTYVCDNDPDKWGKEILGGISCISPGELAKMQDVIVVILVYGKQIASQIAEQLSAMKIDYDYMDNLLACAE